MRRSATRIRVACIAVGLVLAAFLFAYPTKSLIAQERHVNDARRELEAMKRENRALRVQANRLRIPSEIERVAREKYNMVRPNEKAYTVVVKPRNGGVVKPRNEGVVKPRNGGVVKPREETSTDDDASSE